MHEPVIPGFFPDPSVCRVREDYFLACSSFEYFPGVPIFHSRDLVSWRLVANALDRPEQLPLEHAPSSGGICAPTLRHHDGRLWLVTTNVPHEGHLIVTARDPEGPWSDPTYVEGADGIDPDLAWDRDGSCWFTYTGGSVGTSGSILQGRFDPLTGVLLERPRPLWSGTGLQFPEAPHLYDIDGTWYLVIAEGGTERGHAVSIARGSRPDGPFEGFPGNPVLSHRSTDHPVQNIGHADLIQDPDGTWWSLLHGARPAGLSPGFHVLGRETFLAPVRWEDGWPLIGPLEERTVTASASTDERDDFEGARLRPAWVSVRAQPAASLDMRPGWLTLTSTGADLDAQWPAFVGRRQQHRRCLVRARVDASAGRGGLAIRIDERHHYEIETGDETVRACARIGPLRQALGQRAVEREPVILRIETMPTRTHAALDSGGPDSVRLSVETSSGVDLLAELDGRYLSTEVAGGFTGRVIGMYATDGTVAFDWFEYRALPESTSDLPSSALASAVL